MDGPEKGTVLERLAEDRFQALVEIPVVRQKRGLEVGRIDVRQPAGHLHRMIVTQQAHLTAAVQLTFRVDVVPPGRNGEGPFVLGRGHRMQVRLQTYRRLGNGAGLEELYHVDAGGNAPQGFQDQLDVAGPRHDGRMVDAVVCQPGKVLLGKPRLEEQVIDRNLVSDQRPMGVLALSDKHLVVAHDIHRRLLFSRMAGQQMGDRLRPRILGGEVQIYASHEKRTQSLLEAEARIAVSHQSRNTGRHRHTAFQALRDGGLQGAVRCDFKHYVGSIFPPDGFHGSRETHRLANIRPPVGVVQTRCLHAGHRGNERHVGVEVARVEEGQGGQRVILDRVHGGGVEGDVARQQLVLQTASVQLRHDRPQGGFLAADDRVGRRVLAGDLHSGRSFLGPEGNVQRFEYFLHPRPVEADRQHAARTRNALLKGGTVKNQSGGVCQ